MQRGSSTVTSVDWEQVITNFLRGRISSQRRSGIPSVPLNVQYILDGLLLAIDDNPARWTEAWSALAKHVRAKAQQVERLRPAANAQSSSQSTSLNLALGAVYDLLLAWYVIDCVMKGTIISQLKDAIEQELPGLLQSAMPVLWMPSDRSVGVHLMAALDDSRYLFWDLVRSWKVVPKAVRPDTWRRCEERMKRHFDELRAADTTLPPSSEAVEKDVAFLKEVMQPQKQELSGQRLVDAFVGELYSKPRLEFACVHCGAVFDKDSARQAHYRVHFQFRSRQTMDTFVRLRLPSAKEFIAHLPPIGNGDYPVTIATLSDALRGDEFATHTVIRARREDRDQQRRTGESTKRRRIDGIVISDPSVVAICAQCKRRILPVLDPVTSEWILQNVHEKERVGTAATPVYVHDSCP